MYWKLIRFSEKIGQKYFSQVVLYIYKVDADYLMVYVIVFS